MIEDRSTPIRSTALDVNKRYEAQIIVMNNIIKNRYFLSCMMIALILIPAWLFIGIEKIYGEFEEDTEYEFFIKEHISTQIFFIDPTNCNAGCDMPALNHLNKKMLEQFSDYCLYRYNLSPVERCYSSLYKND